jgi:hypothetical protein
VLHDSLLSDRDTLPVKVHRTTHLMLLHSTSPHLLLHLEQSILLESPVSVLCCAPGTLHGTIQSAFNPLSPTPPLCSYPDLPNPTHIQIASLTERVLSQLAALRSRLINLDYGQPAVTEEGVDKSFTVSGYYGKLHLRTYRIS